MGLGLRGVVPCVSNQVKASTLAYEVPVVMHCTRPLHCVSQSTCMVLDCFRTALETI